MQLLWFLSLRMLCLFWTLGLDSVSFPVYLRDICFFNDKLMMTFL